MIVPIPMPLPSAANLREHWRVRAKRIKTQRATVAMFLRGPAPALPVVVTLTRIAPRALDDDNLQSAFKGVRDEVARWFGVPDNVPGIRWEYGQRRGAPKVYGIEVSVVSSVSCAG